MSGSLFLLSWSFLSLQPDTIWCSKVWQATTKLVKVEISYSTSQNVSAKSVRHLLAYLLSSTRVTGMHIPRLTLKLLPIEAWPSWPPLLNAKPLWFLKVPNKNAPNLESDRVFNHLELPQYVTNNLSIASYNSCQNLASLVSISLMWRPTCSICIR